MDISKIMHYNYRVSNSLSKQSLGYGSHRAYFAENANLREGNTGIDSKSNESTVPIN